ncbi:MAG: pyridoxal-phosphate dependent enzyme [Candidatus Latescibacteria bacterium]|nr:pyridoxal-phosphate dependent enzyme [Candidatus Latescibacterota bacterium]
MDAAAIQRAIDRQPRLDLIDLPTPLHFCPRLTAELGGPRIFIKRDDLTGLALGGNKSRYLEFTLGEVVDRGCNAAVISAVVQSNHCRQFAAAVAKQGLKGVVVLRQDDTPMGRSQPVNGNYLLNHLFGAEVRMARRDDIGQAIAAALEDLRQAGYTPAQVPGPPAAVSYIQTALELDAQCRAQEVDLGHIFISSGGTSLSGLVAGFNLLDQAPHFVGLPQSRPANTDAAPQQVVQRAQNTAQLIGLSCDPNPAHIHVEGDYVGPGFGVVDDRTHQAILLLARTEGILVDPTYTGKAFAGLVDYIRRGLIPSASDVVFVHTGGVPLNFVYGEELFAAGT